MCFRWWIDCAHKACMCAMHRHHSYTHTHTLSTLYYNRLAPISFTEKACLTALQWIAHICVKVSFSTTLWLTVRLLKIQSKCIFPIIVCISGSPVADCIIFRLYNRFNSNRNDVKKSASQFAVHAVGIWSGWFAIHLTKNEILRRILSTVKKKHPKKRRHKKLSGFKLIYIIQKASHE